MRLRIVTQIFVAFVIWQGIAARSSLDAQHLDPSAQSQPQVALTLKQAVEMALGPEGNASVRLAQGTVHLAETTRSQARASLLPNLDSTIIQQDQTRNLAAFGIRFSAPVPGFTFPEVVGPFGTFDARVAGSQTLFDLSAIRRFQAARSVVEAARSDETGVRETVIADVTRTYLQAWQARSTYETVQSSVELAEALWQLADNQKSAGTGTGIEVTRARVQLANERQRLLAAGNQYRAAVLRLARAIGLKAGHQIQITEQFDYEPPHYDAESALGTARLERADLASQRQRVETARLNYSASKWERLPSLAGFADYGSIGTGIDRAIPTRTYGVMMRIPLFDGGGRDARRAEKRIQLEQETVRLHDLESAIETEVLIALDNLQSAEQQIVVAEEGVQLAEAELAQAQRRYRAGVTTGLEVTEAQNRFERARNNRISALFSYQLARVEVGLATGTVEAILK
jgi:outer membrane protein